MPDVIDPEEIERLKELLRVGPPAPGIPGERPPLPPFPGIIPSRPRPSILPMPFRDVPPPMPPAAGPRFPSGPSPETIQARQDVGYGGSTPSAEVTAARAELAPNMPPMPWSPESGIPAPLSAIPDSPEQRDLDVDEASNEDQRRRDRIRKLEGFRALAQAGEDVGSGIVNAAWMRAGAAPPLRPRVSQLEEDIKLERDRVPKTFVKAIRAKGYELPDDVTFTQLQQMMPMLRSGAEDRNFALRSGIAERNLALREREVDLAEQGLEGREGREERLVGAARAKIGDDFDRLVKKDREMINAARAAVNASNINAMGQFAASIKAARASGEVGALNDADKAPFEHRQALVDRIADFYQRWVHGEQTPELKKQIQDLMQSYIDSAEEAIRLAGQRVATRHAGRFGLTEDEIMSKVLGIQAAQPAAGAGPSESAASGRPDYAPPPGWIWVRNKDGEWGKIRETDWGPEAERDGYRRD